MWQSTQGGWFLAVNQFAQSTPVLHTPMRLYAEYGVVLFAAFLLAAWWWARRDQDPTSMAAALWAPAGALLAIGLNQPLVNHFHQAHGPTPPSPMLSSWWPTAGTTRSPATTRSWPVPSPPACYSPTDASGPRPRCLRW
jgi:hypothetical protein